MDPEQLPEPPFDLTPLHQSIALMAHLRGPEGCPWDREQTFDSIQRHTLEETYEVFDAIDRRAWPELQDELGDLLLQVLFYAQMASEAGYFNLAGVASTLNRKLIRRHPHIFADARANTPDEVKLHWDRIKREEKAAAQAPHSNVSAPHHLDQVPRHTPALLEAEKLGAAAAKVGFDWPDIEGLFHKLAEETAELRAELQPNQPGSPRASEELGDLLFTAVNLARHLHLQPEFALRGANARFRRRFNSMEAAAGGPEALRAASPAQLEAWWQQAKRFTSPEESPAAASLPPGSSTPEPA